MSSNDNLMGEWLSSDLFDDLPTGIPPLEPEPDDEDTEDAEDDKDDK